jgi:hypothetical protein
MISSTATHKALLTTTRQVASAYLCSITHASISSPPAATTVTIADVGGAAAEACVLFSRRSGHRTLLLQGLGSFEEGSTIYRISQAPASIRVQQQVLRPDCRYEALK